MINGRSRRGRVKYRMEVDSMDTEEIRRGIYWRGIRGMIETNMIYLDKESIEYQNALRRVRWINENRL
jgi:hypothetical protein